MLSPSENALLQPRTLYASRFGESGTSSCVESSETFEESSDLMETSDESTEASEDRVGRRNSYGRVFVDDDAVEVSDGEAQDEDDALFWDNYGSGYDTDGNGHHAPTQIPTATMNTILGKTALPRAPMRDMCNVKKFVRRSPF